MNAILSMALGAALAPRAEPMLEALAPVEPSLPAASAVDFAASAPARSIEPAPSPTTPAGTSPAAPDRIPVRVELPSALDALGRAPTTAPADSEPIGPAELALEPVARSPRPAGNRKVRELGPVGILGTAVGLGGLGVMSYGCWEVAKGRRHEIDPHDEERLVFHDHTRGGWALYGVGLGITAVGIALITVDVSALYERRARRLAVSPVFDSTHAGLRLRGRF